MDSFQKILNDGVLTRMEKYSVITASEGKLLMGTQGDDAIMPLFSMEHV